MTGQSWRSLATEQRNPRSEALDTLSANEIVALVLDEDRRGLDAAEKQRESIAQAAEWLAETLAGPGVVLLVGAGTSGRLGILEAAECPPTFGTSPKTIRAAIAGGRSAVFEACEGAEDQPDGGRAAARGMAGGDLLIGLSASSVTPYVRGALAAARQQGTRAILITCAARDGLETEADLVIGLDTGPEVVTGSTRLKAGSATKAVLNAITTAAMVRLGKVYGNLMVDLRPGSAKLRDRALRIIEAVAGVPPETAESLYSQADGDVKAAIVMGHCHVIADEAKQRLKAVGGRLRDALESDDA